MQKTKNYFSKTFQTIKSWSTRRKIVAAVALLLVIFFLSKAFGSGNTDQKMVIESVHSVDLKQNVLATGQVTSKTDLNLSFNNSGVLKSLRVNVGDTVKAGQILATLDQGSELAALTSARGALASAKARYDRTLAGASNEEITLAQVALDNAIRDYDTTKSEQDVLVQNAYAKMLSTDLVATSNTTNSSNSATMPTISGTYIGEPGDYILNLYAASSTPYFNTSGIESFTGNINTSYPTKLGTKGLFIQFPSNFTFSSYQNLTVSVPNIKSSSYVTNYNAYQSALKTKESALGGAQALIDQRTAELAIKKSAARPAEMALADADILSAQGQYQLASSNFEHTLLRAPVEGTITKIDIKLGELAQSLKNIMVLQDVTNLYIEALINESNIAYLQIGQPVAVSFDAFGKDKIFTGAVMHIDPSSDTSDGVVNYKIKVSINEKDAMIRPGMNANINIEAGSKNNVLAIPGAAITKENGKSFVNFVTNEKKQKYEKREVTTGFASDGNMVEIVSGLSLNDKIIFVQK